MRISDWSSDVCSSDLIISRNPAKLAQPPQLRVGKPVHHPFGHAARHRGNDANLDQPRPHLAFRRGTEIGRAHVCTPVTNAHIVCRLPLAKKKQQSTSHEPNSKSNEVNTEESNR